jgi:hypothetical protein
MAKAIKRFWGVVWMAAMGLGCSSVPVVPGASSAPEAGGGGAAVLSAPITSTPIYKALTNADAYFITQYHHARYNPAQASTNNANCGPTSLAMAVSAFGKQPTGLSGSAHAQELIRSVRKAMTGQVDENTWTYPYQVYEGAQRLGLHAQMVYGHDEIVKAMRQPGRLMVVNLNPSPAYADQLAIPYDGGHFALLTHVEGDKAYLSDPLGPAPLVISVKQLGTALTTPLGQDPHGNFVPAFDGGVMVWN